MRPHVDSMLKDLEAFERNHAGTARLLAIAEPLELVKMARTQTARIVGPPPGKTYEALRLWRANAEMRLLNLQFAMSMRDALETGGGLTWAPHLH